MVMASPPQTITVLHVEDNPGDARAVRDLLGLQVRFNCEITVAVSLHEAEERLSPGAKGRVRYDLVIWDLSLPDCDPIGTLVRAGLKVGGAPFIVMTAHSHLREVSR